MCLSVCLSGPVYQKAKRSITESKCDNISEMEQDGSNNGNSDDLE